MGGLRNLNSALGDQTMKAAGAAMVVDGLIGFDNPLRRTRRPGLFGALAMIPFGAIFMAAGYFFILPMGQPLDGGVVVQGRVVSVDTYRNNDDQTIYTPTVEYRAGPEGGAFRVKSNVSSGGQVSVGDTKKVSYMPGEPAQAKVIEDGTKLFFWIFFGAGALLAFAGAVTFIKRLFTIGLGVFLLARDR